MQFDLRSKYHLVRKDPLFIWCARLILLFVIPTSLLLILKTNKLPPEIPLYYSLPWGEEQLAQPLALYLVLGGLVLTALLNTFLSLLLFSSTKILSRILMFAAVGIVFLGIVTICQIILLVT